MIDNDIKYWLEYVIIVIGRLNWSIGKVVND